MTKDSDFVRTHQIPKVAATDPLQVNQPWNVSSIASGKVRV